MMILIKGVWKHERKHLQVCRNYHRHFNRLDSGCRADSHCKQQPKIHIGEFTLPIPEYVLHFGGILIGCLVLSGYCIWKDAYWGLNNNRKRYGIILVVAGLLNALPLYMALSTGSGSDFPYVNLLTCIMLLVVGIELLLKHFLDQHAENAEDKA